MNLAQAVASNARAVAEQSTADMRRMLGVLQSAEREAAAGLARYLRTADGSSTYTLHQHRALLIQLRTSIGEIERKLAAATGGDLATETARARAVSIAKLRAVAEAGSRRFHTPPLRIDLAASLGRTGSMLIDRFASSAARYAGDVRRDIGARLMIGVVKGETHDQLVNRLLGGGFAKALKRDGITDRHAAGAAGKVFSTYRSWGERLVRTEIVNAYNLQQADAIQAMEVDDPGWLKKWDASNDARTCLLCRALNGEIVGPTGMFSAGVLYAPLHPYCRCTIVAWRREWKE